MIEIRRRCEKGAIALLLVLCQVGGTCHNICRCRGYCQHLAVFRTGRIRAEETVETSTEIGVQSGARCARGTTDQSLRHGSSDSCALLSVSLSLPRISGRLSPTTFVLQGIDFQLRFMVTWPAGRIGVLASHRIQTRGGDCWLLPSGAF